jgi:hypothetical protein
MRTILVLISCFALAALATKCYPDSLDGVPCKKAGQNEAEVIIINGPDGGDNEGDNNNSSRRTATTHSYGKRYSTFVSSSGLSYNNQGEMLLIE